MKIPLKIDTFVSREGEQYIKIWNNSENKIMKSPILPYIYSKDNPIPFTNSKRIKNMQLLYDGTYDTIYKNEFRNVSDMYDVAYDITHMEARVKVLDRIYYDKPTFINKYANSEELKILYVDIETDTENLFPNAQENAIIAIGLAINNGPITLLMADTYNDDSKILKEMFKYIKENDPDIIVGYNSGFFDIPYICDRCTINSISTSGFGRGSREVFITDKKIYIEGRIHYDIFERSVKLDQQLFKKAPKNRKMKTVARIYKLPNIIEEDETALSNMRALVGTQRLYDYLYSDIQITRGLSNIYLPAIISLAERINVTLESCIDGSPAFIANTIFSRKYKETNIISDKTVITANPELGDKQGALVGSFAPGLYLDGVRKFDVLSYYPNLVRTLNLDPLTTKIIQVKNKLEPYQATMSDDKILTLSIPDTKLNKQIIITVDMNIRGFTSTFVDELMIERMELKSKMEMLDDNSPEWASLDVNQLAIKVILNSITGYFGQGWATFGSLASYMAITGSGRFLIQTLIDKMGHTIALDTDGIVISSKEDIKDVNIWLEEFVLNFYDIDKNYIELEEEIIESAYFRDANKQYLVLQDNKLIIHGASFKGSNLPKIFSTIIEDIGLRMLKGDSNLEDAIDVYYDSNQFTLGNIKKSIKIKPVDNYASKNPIGRQLGIQYEKRFGVKIKHETRLEYVKIKSKRGSSYQLVTIFDNMEDIERLDTDYYIKIVNNAIDRLGLTHIRPDQRAQTSIFDF